MKIITELFLCGSTEPGKFLISAYRVDDPDWELNHKEIDLLPRKRSDSVSCHVEVNILQNVLAQAGIRLFEE